MLKWIKNSFFKTDKKNIDIHIYYATSGGNAHYVAEKCKKFYKEHGKRTKVFNISRLNISKLASIDKALFIVSTDGEGSPPLQAESFFNQIMKKDTPLFNHLSYSVCALGDSSYENFCSAGKALDERLKKLNARCIESRKDCDANFAKPSMEWIRSTFRSYYPDIELKEQTEDADKHTEKKVFEGKIQNVKLLNPKSSSPCYDLELENKNNSFSFECGDCIELKPINPEWLVDEVMMLLGFENDSKIKTYLSQNAELTRLSSQVIERYGEIVGHENLLQKLKNGDRMQDYIQSANVADLLRDFPAPITKDTITEIFAELAYRQYSIASSPENKDTIRLTVKKIAYLYGNYDHAGAGSNFVIEKDTQHIAFRHYSSPHFHLPIEKSTPIIMIGVGTGIAPFLSFIEHKKRSGEKRELCLFWGEKYRDRDFLYQEELESYNNEGILNHLFLAFSRSEGEKASYVHEAIEQEKPLFIDLLEKGAHIYVCGSVAMGNSVKNVMRKLLGEQYYYELVKDVRYHQDVY